MKTFKVSKKTYIKSFNSIKKINLNYMYTLITTIIFIIVYNIIQKNTNYTIELIKTTIITIIISIIIQYIINFITTKDKDIKRLFIKDNIIVISLILSLFLTNTNILIKIISIFLTIGIKKIFKNINFFSVAYGILFILTYKYITNQLSTPLINLSNIGYIGSYEEIVKSNGTFISYLLGKHYLSPLTVIISFIYLFSKRVIKYNLIISYLITFFIIMSIFGIFNGMNIWYGFYQLLLGNTMFLSIYCLSDHTTSPTISEGQIIYGIILGILTAISRFIIPDISIIIVLIIGQLFITKIIEKISIRLKYNQKFYTLTISVCILFGLITSIILIKII